MTFEDTPTVGRFLRSLEIDPIDGADEPVSERDASRERSEDVAEELDSLTRVQLGRFTSERDDCSFAPSDQECWRTGEPEDQHRDVWVMNADGSEQRRVTSEAGQFVAWSPDGRYLLVSGRALYVVRPDGTGRLGLRAEGINLPLGGIPDWR